MGKVNQKKVSGGKGGEATLGKNTLKAGCGCALPPRSSDQITFVIGYGSLGVNNEDLFIKLFKSLAPGRAAGGLFFMS